MGHVPSKLWGLGCWVSARISVFVQNGGGGGKGRLLWAIIRNVAHLLISCKQWWLPGFVGSMMADAGRSECSILSSQHKVDLMWCEHVRSLRGFGVWVLGFFKNLSVIVQNGGGGGGKQTRVMRWAIKLGQVMADDDLESKRESKKARIIIFVGMCDAWGLPCAPVS